MVPLRTLPRPPGRPTGPQGSEQPGLSQLQNYYLSPVTSFPHLFPNQTQFSTCLSEAPQLTFLSGAGGSLSFLVFGAHPQDLDCFLP